MILFIYVPRQEVPPELKEVYGDILWEPWGEYPHKPLNTSRWYTASIHQLAMVYILLNFNFDEVDILTCCFHSNYLTKWDN